MAQGQTASKREEKKGWRHTLKGRYWPNDSTSSSTLRIANSANTSIPEPLGAASTAPSEATTDEPSASKVRSLRLKSTLKSKSRTHVRASSSRTIRPKRSLARSTHSRLSSSTDATQDGSTQGYLTIHPRIYGVFTPQLPPELWLHILHCASACEPVDNDNGDEFWSPYVYKRSSYATYFPSSSSSSASEPSSPSASPAYADAPHTFLTSPNAHTHLPERLAAYNKNLFFRAQLTRVCRLWNVIGQEVLYHQVWVNSAREGRRIAGRLGGDFGVGLTVHESYTTVQGGIGKKPKNRWWKSKARTSTTHTSHPRTSISHKRSFSTIAVPTSTSLPSTSLTTPTLLSSWNTKNPGTYIRHLRIETPPMEKCSPHDVLLILQHCGERLEIVEDCRSVRRPRWALTLSGEDKSGLGEEVLTTDALAHAVLSRPLKRLTWTNYAREADGYGFGNDSSGGEGPRLYTHLVAPLLGRVGSKLEVLEVVGGFDVGVDSPRSASGESGWGVGHVHGGSTGGSDGDAEREIRRRKSARNSVGLPSLASMGIPGLGLSSGLSAGFGIGSASLLTEMTAEYTTTTQFISPSHSMTPSNVGETETHPYSLSLPSLVSLKATLSNTTFYILSTWYLPKLRNLSIVSADSYANATSNTNGAGGAARWRWYNQEGFRTFMDVHGAKIEQLELGHAGSSGGVEEEVWVTEPPASANPTLSTPTPSSSSAHPLPLSLWCPNLLEFICSADAEWNWQQPDWIAPHVLLPTHPMVRFIGVRGMEKRLRRDLEESRRRERYGYGGYGGANGDRDAHFALLEQFGSLLRKEAFPSLLYVRDMSVESDVMRRTGKMAGLDGELPVLALNLGPSLAAPAPALLVSSSQATRILNPRRLLPSGHAHGQTQGQGIPLNLRDQLALTNGSLVLQFWMAVVDRCRERGVWLEDWRGVNVTKGELRRVEAGV